MWTIPVVIVEPFSAFSCLIIQYYSELIVQQNYAVYQVNETLGYELHIVNIFAVKLVS